MQAGQKKILSGLAAAHLVTDIYLPVLPAILPLLILDNGYSFLAAGLLVTAYNLTSSCTQPVLGWLADKKGFSVSISISLLISGVFIALIGIAGDYRIIMLLAILALEPGDNLGDILRAGLVRYQQGIRCVDDDKIVDTDRSHK